MAVGCGAKFAKIVLIIFNIIFLCTGLVLIALGIWLLVTLSQQWGPTQIFSLASGNSGNSVLSESNLYRNSAILLISIGCFILFVTILGLVAAIKESVILLSIYAVLLFLVFAGEIAGGVVAIVYKDRILDEIDSTLRTSLKFTGNDSQSFYYVGDPSTTMQCQASFTGRLWDYVQLYFDCCGVDANDGTNGYNSAKINPCNFSQSLQPPQLKKPLTCCHNNISTGEFNSQNQEYFKNRFNCSNPIYNDCVGEIKAWIVKYAPVLIGIGIGFGMLELYGFIFVICLCMNTDKGFKRF